MKKLKVKDIYISWGLLCFHACCLVSGFFFSRWFLAGAAISVCVWLLHLSAKLRCPRCGGMVSLAELTRALNQNAYCRLCGEKIGYEERKC